MYRSHHRALLRNKPQWLPHELHSTAELIHDSSTASHPPAVHERAKYVKALATLPPLPMFRPDDVFLDHAPCKVRPCFVHG